MLVRFVFAPLDDRLTEATPGRAEIVVQSMDGYNGYLDLRPCRP